MITSMFSHKNVIEALEELSDVSFQEKIWFALGKDKYDQRESSIEEAFCHLYWDSGLAPQLNSGALIYSSAVDEQLQQLHALVEPLCANVNTVEDLHSASMDEVRRRAKKLVTAIREVRPS